MSQTVRTHTTALRSLAARLRQVRQAELGRIDRMFRTLGPRLATARRVEREMDRRLARRFNPLDYLRTDEMGLSRILADLLDPQASHGQGAVFLERFLAKVSPAFPGQRAPALLPESAKTRCERVIDTGGRLDISIEMTVGAAEVGEKWCIAIENKPYAGDGEGQVASYLEYLRRVYPGRFFLIYLSPRGGLPSSESLPGDAAKDGFATLSYCPRPTDESWQLDFALTDWLRECGLSCEVNRLRWFLRDVERFCHTHFGGRMTTDAEHKEVRAFILESEENARTAVAVATALASTRAEVVAGFFDALCERVSDRLEQDNRDEWVVRPRNDGRGLGSKRDGWKGEIQLYQEFPRDGSWAKPPTCWVGVLFEAGDGQDELARALVGHLGEEKRDRNYPWFVDLDEPNDWATLFVQMNAERREPGSLIDDFADRFVEVAKAASEIIDGASG